MILSLYRHEKGMKIKIKKIVLSPSSILFVGSLLIGIASIFQNTEWLVLPALMLFLYYLDDGRFTRKNAYLDFYISGIIICCFAYVFLLELEPSNWEFAFTGRFSIVAGFVAWLLASSFSALSFLLIPFFIKRIHNINARLMVFPFALVLAEIFRGILFSIISFGPGSELGISYNWGSVAVIGSNSPVIYSSRVVGFYGMTIIIGILAVAAYYLLIRKRLLIPIGILIIVFVITLVGFLNRDHKNYELNIVSVHLNEFDTMSNWDNFDLLPSSIDLLVLPEYSEIRLNERFGEILGKLSTEGVIITTVSNGESPDATNDLVVIDKSNNEISRQSKQNLIPAGEYLPYSLLATFKAIGKQDSINLFNYSQKIQPGENSISAVEYNDVTYGALPCSGVLSPVSYRDLTNDGADVLVNPASLAFLKAGSKYHVFAKRMARFQAVYSSKHFIQASRSGESYVITPNGEFQAQNIDSSTQIIESTVNLE